MSKYPSFRFILESGQFKRTRGELGTDDMSDAEFEAHTNSLSEDEQNDYIQEGVFGKELAKFVEDKMTVRGYEVAENYADDWGRCVEIVSTDAKEVVIGCFNHADGTETEDGTEHMISVVAQPSLKARFFKDQSLFLFANKVATELENLISETPHITLIGKEED